MITGSALDCTCSGGNRMNFSNSCLWSKHLHFIPCRFLLSLTVGSAIYSIAQENLFLNPVYSESTLYSSVWSLCKESIKIKHRNAHISDRQCFQEWYLIIVSCTTCCRDECTGLHALSIVSASKSSIGLLSLAGHTQEKNILGCIQFDRLSFEEWHFQCFTFAGHTLGTPLCAHSCCSLRCSWILETRWAVGSCIQ